MSNLREIKAAMPHKFVEQFRDKADTIGMTHRQLAATCIALGYKAFCDVDTLPSLPSEPLPGAAIKAENEVASRAAGGGGAKRSLPFTLAAFGAIGRKDRGAA